MLAIEVIAAYNWKKTCWMGKLYFFLNNVCFYWLQKEGMFTVAKFVKYKKTIEKKIFWSSVILSLRNNYY